MTNSEMFEILGLPIEAVSLPSLEEAYQNARRTWFFRQYEAEHMLEARRKLDLVDEAYRMLRDVRRQPAIVREAKAERLAGAKRQAGRVGVDAKAAGSPPRTKIVRDMIRAADDIVLHNGPRLSDEDVVRLARAGFDQGLEYADALDVADRIARRVASSSGV